MRNGSMITAIGHLPGALRPSVGIIGGWEGPGRGRLRSAGALLVRELERGDRVHLRLQARFEVERLVGGARLVVAERGTGPLVRPDEASGDQVRSLVGAVRQGHS